MTVQMANGRALASGPSDVSAESKSRAVDPQDRNSAVSVQFALIALAIAALFFDRFHQLFLTWMEDDNYSHGFLVPFVSGFLAWSWLQDSRAEPHPKLIAGLSSITLGCVLHLVANIVWYPPVDYVALVAILVGVAMLFGGTAWARGLLFPVLFLFFMFPLPVALTERVAIRLQLIVAEYATHLLRFFLPTFNEGYFIYLPGQQLEVGEACSGLRQVVAFAALTLLVSYMSERPLLAKVGLVVSGFFVAIAANLVRVLLMAGVMRWFGPKWTSGAYHSAWGLLSMALGLGMLWGVNWWLGKFIRPAEEDGDAAASSPRERRDRGFGIVKPRLGGAIACLWLAVLGQFLLMNHLQAGEVGEAPGLQSALTGFPVSLGAWQGKDTLPTTLPYYEMADDRLCRNYRLSDGPEAGLDASLWMVHFMNGKDRQHHPIICYKVAGFVEELSGNAKLRLPGRQAPIERFAFTRDGVTSYVYYWHYTFEPPRDGNASLLQLIHQRRGRLLPSITIEVFTTPKTSNQLESLNAFVQRVDDQLRQHLPAGARMGSEILPVRYTGDPRNGPTR